MVHWGASTRTHSLDQTQKTLTHARTVRLFGYWLSISSFFWGGGGGGGACSDRLLLRTCERVHVAPSIRHCFNFFPPPFHLAFSQPSSITKRCLSWKRQSTCPETQRRLVSACARVFCVRCVVRVCHPTLPSPFSNPAVLAVFCCVAARVRRNQSAHAPLLLEELARHKQDQPVPCNLVRVPMMARS